MATEPIQHTPFYYSEWVSYWSKRPLEAYRAVVGKSWEECRHVRERAAIAECMFVLGDIMESLGIVHEQRSDGSVVLSTEPHQDQELKERQEERDEEDDRTGR